MPPDEIRPIGFPKWFLASYSSALLVKSRTDFDVVVEAGVLATKELARFRVV
jgi:hypothetical protein